MSQDGPGLVERVRVWIAGQLFLLAGRLDPEHFDVWLDDAPRRTHLPGDDEYPDVEGATE